MTLPAAQATTWTGPAQVTNDANTHYSASVVQDQTGTVYLFWDQNPGIYYTITSTGNIAGNIWPAPTQYTRNSNFDIEPAPVALKNGTLIMFFSSKRGSNFDIYYSKYNNGVWSPETRLTTSPAPDQGPTAMQDSSGKIWLAWTRNESGDINVKFVDSNGNGAWDPGESIVYDPNGNGVYDSGEPVIAGTSPTPGTVLKFDPRIGFVDANGNARWDPGEFVVYDANVDAVYDPKLMFIDSNRNNVWDQGETIAYDANADGVYTSHTGVGRCTGISPPSLDCFIIGSLPGNQTQMGVDQHLKFVDLNGDGLWEPGKTLVYDSNNNGLYDTGEQAIAALIGDLKLEYIGSGTTWASGNTVVYDVNSNGVYDGKIKFVDDTFTGHWVTGDTVVYDTNLNNFYDLTDTAIFETTPQGDLGKQLKNDPALRFINSTGNPTWVPGEAVVYDPDLNGVYDGNLMFVKSGTNTTWVRGEAVVYDANGDGKYNTGKFYNDTVVAGLPPANNTALSPDPKVKFYDINANTVWDVGEPVVYDANNNNLYDAEITISTSVPNPGAKIRTDTKIEYVRKGTNSTWVPGETVAYDTNGDGKYTTGKFYNDTLITGVAPANNTLLSFDPNVKYVNATINPSETWTPGKSMVYDANGNSLYDAEILIAGQSPRPTSGVTSGLGEQVVSPASPAVGSILKTDPKVEYYRTGTNTTWVPGESIVYDSNGNGVYDGGEPIIVGTPPPLGTNLTIDPKLKYFDSYGNGVWDSSEAIVYDLNNNNVYDFGEYLVRGIIPQAGTGLAANIGEAWIAGPPPIPGTALKSDSKIKLVDLNGNNHWDQGEPVEYDTNNNGIFDTGDVVIAGSPVPSIGTPLKSDEITLAGTFAAIGTRYTSPTDPKIEFVDANGNGHWDPGETVVYDTASNGKYTTGKFFNDTIISGAAPLNNTALTGDPKFKYFDASQNGHWDNGERVFYDSDNDNDIVYDANDAIVAVFQAPSSGARLVNDPKLKYFETGADTHWDLGESVVYDVNNTGTFAIGDIVIAGPVPSVGTTLSSDSLIRFVDDTGNGLWDKGETVVYDSNNNNVYDSGEKVILSSNPAPGTPLRNVTHIFYKTYNGGSWSSEQRLTIQQSDDRTPSITQTEDGRLWIAWSGQRTGGPNKIFYRTSTDGVNWIPEAALTNSAGTYGDNDPSITQDRNGTIWMIFSRNVPCSCGTAVFQADLYSTSSLNNGATWSAPTPLTSTTGQDEILPSLSQLNDRNLYIFFSTINCGGGSCTVNIYYFKTLIQIHDARMNFFTTNATTSVTLGPTIRAGQILRLSANVSNTGDFSDTLMLTVKANSTLIPTNSSVVSIGQSKIIFINWGTTGMKSGTYVLTANVTTTTGAEGFANLVDNVATFTVLIRPAGDVDGNCVVNIIDFVIVAGTFGKSVGDPAFNPIADLNHDGTINITDLSIVGGSFGQRCPGH